MNFNKFTVPCLVGLTAAGCAQATEVELYGTADAYVQVYNNGSTTSALIGSGGIGSSRFGIRGTEQLGGNNAVFFNLENGYLLDTGKNSPSSGSSGGYAWQRETMIGIRGDWGQLKAGYQVTLNFIQQAMFDAFGLSLGSTMNNFMTPAPYVAGTHTPGFNGLGAQDNYTRRNNSFIYTTPNMGGLKVSAMFSLGEQGKNNSYGNSYSVQAVYRDKAFAIGATWSLEGLVEAASVATKKNPKNQMFGIGTSYDFGITKAFMNFQYRDSDGACATNPKLWVVGGGFKTPLKGGYLMNGVHFLKNNSTKDSNAWDIGTRYDYPISKRTTVYAGAVYMNNESNVNYSIHGGGGSSAAPVGQMGKNPWTMFTGINHRF